MRRFVAALAVLGFGLPALADSAEVRISARPADDPTDFYEWELDQDGVVTEYMTETIAFDETVEVTAASVAVRYRRCLHADGSCGAWSEGGTFAFVTDGDLDQDDFIGLGDFGLFARLFGTSPVEYQLCLMPVAP